MMWLASSPHVRLLSRPSIVSVSQFIARPVLALVVREPTSAVVPIRTIPPTRAALTMIPSKANIKRCRGRDLVRPMCQSIGALLIAPLPLSAASRDLVGKGGPGVLPWRGLGNPAWGQVIPDFLLFPKKVC